MNWGLECRRETVGGEIATEVRILAVSVGECFDWVTHVVTALKIPLQHSQV